MVDAHTHLDFAEFDADRDAVVARARAAGVATFVVCGSDPDRWDHAAAIARAHGGVAALGIHPWTASGLDADGLAPWLDRLRAWTGPIGEIGLDALWATDDVARANQRRAVREQLALARDRDAVVVLHCVRAYPELLALAVRDGLPRAGGMVHAWSGPPELVPRALALGLHLSFGPMILRDRARKARASVREVPADRLLVETDCPNMLPPGETRGEPSHLPRVVAELAALRGEDPAAIAAITAQNARRLLFGA
ncbi:MAG: TatD family hydrolase [Myxococcota bacterium]